MPLGDGTGPRGDGPGTGKGMGNCGGERRQGRSIRGGRGRINNPANRPISGTEKKDDQMNNISKIAVIDEGERIGCGACIPTCPNEAITLDDKAKIDESKCTACGTCVDSCPVDAINIQ